MRLCMTVYNKPHVVTAFFLEAIKMAEWFQCKLSFKSSEAPEDWVGTTAFLPMGLGPALELEINVEGPGSETALQLIQYLMQKQFAAAQFSGN